MNRTLSITRSSRQVLLHYLESYRLEQLNKVPPGCNNNIIWNIGHVIVVQQMLVYRLSGLPMMVSDEMVDRYKRGTRPEADATPDEILKLKELLFTTIDQTEKDLDSAIFHNYQSFTTMSGFTLSDAITAMEFNNYHEGVHTGMIMSLKKFI
ncbi:MAG TPA: DinB family protein [Flavobacterium sp.]|jgi:hypothetical protein